MKHHKWDGSARGGQKLGSYKQSLKMEVIICAKASQAYSASWRIDELQPVQSKVDVTRKADWSSNLHIQRRLIEFRERPSYGLGIEEMTILLNAICFVCRLN